ncbi:MAG: hypothetical protein K2P84_07085, partial [Undibacterium sp.]|nr:hypothetical protein [Undibacterium sp.]
MPTNTSAALSKPQLDLHTLLERCRAACMAGQYEDLPALLSTITSAPLSPEQAFLLEVIMLYPGASQPPLPHSQLHQRALRLLELSLSIGTPLAKAWIWELLQLLQINQELYHAALHSTAMAVEMFEHCGRKKDALSMRVSRCLVMVHCEMFKEVIEMSSAILLDRALLTPNALCNILRSLGSANYFLGNSCDDEQAILYWRQSLEAHEACLVVAEEYALRRFTIIAHTNIAVLSACLGLRSSTTHHLLKIEGMQDTADQINPSWPYWLRYCEVLLQCQSAEHEQGWLALLRLSKNIPHDEPLNNPVLEAVLSKVVSIGRQSKHFEDALTASQTQLELNHKRRRLLVKTLGDTVEDVMAVPKLVQKNLELSQQGHVLENALARRNQELSSSLEQLRLEAEVRRHAESALQIAHAELEDQVRLRSAELERALSVVMRQEKQLALGRMVVGVAHELNTPLGNATMAASTMNHLCETLVDDLTNNNLSRQRLQNNLETMIEGNLILSRALKTASTLVQRFRGLAISQHQESLVKFNLSHRCEMLLVEWRPRLSEQKIQVSVDIEQGIEQIGYPNALCQVLDQLLA